jgi:hypothetical protein
MEFLLPKISKINYIRRLKSNFFLNNGRFWTRIVARLSFSLSVMLMFLGKMTNRPWRASSVAIIMYVKWEICD